MTAPAASRPGETLYLEAVVRRPAAAGLWLQLAAPPGVTVLLGPSGSGKSTTLDVIAGHLLPDEGQVRLGTQTLLRRVAGQPAAINLPPQLRGIGYVLQNQALFPHLTVQQNLAFGLFHRPPRERAARVAELAERLALSALLARRPSELSGGQRQRVALGRALAPAPRALLLDEPLSAVDLLQRRDLLGRLRELLSELDIPVVYVTHSEEELRFWGRPAIELRPRVTADPSEPAIETAPVPFP
jgi:molybdate transport system ATP-binding protein